MLKSQLSIRGLLKIEFDSLFYVLRYYVWIASELPFVQELGNAFVTHLHQVYVNAFLSLDDFPSQSIAVSCYFYCYYVILRVRILVHETCGATTNLRLMKVSHTKISDLWHVRLKGNRSTFASQFTDYFSHFGGSTLSFCYGHKTEGITRVLVADGI